MLILRGLIGLVFFCLVAWALSSARRRFPWRAVLGGLAFQVVLAALLLGTSGGHRFFEGLADKFSWLISKAEPGAKLVFGVLADPQAMGEVFGPKAGFVFAFAGTGLAAILFFSALMAVLYHLGVMQVLIWLLAKVMSLVMGVSGAESMAVAANVFVGQTEAPLVVRPYIATMTQSELNALMTGGFATIAGSVLAVYMGILGPELGPHLLTASVLSAPAAFMIAKIIVPETETPVTSGSVELRIERSASNVIEAAANGTADGLKLWLNVIAMLIGFMGLVALADGLLAEISGNSVITTELSLSGIFGWVFAPVAWMMGIEGWADCQLVGSLLGTKIAVNEFVAFSVLEGMEPGSGAAAVLSPRSATMAAYALCGFANFASIGIQIGGIGALVPERRRDLAQLAFKAMLGGAIASWTTATVAGMFLS
ncbi:NupC/NupG family nucleoside CNT transporter [Engelhardtia mirabilis]|uniref:Nucleoside permease NupX n=1 Tax=Engelhardtia mirabilis TaxID=2528011 RepID=A0A518BDJ6_9BACT|nr:Nucleoside permease NupX [Planctomycetes bacterium Pla133]QDU99370.1 Nucleoside permease NupX [Planctomycetes bacterium Pla86]